MPSGSPVKIKIYARAVTAILLIITWALIVLSGIILYLAPSGFRSGRQELWLGLTKSAWDNVHFWIGVTAVVVIIVHIIIDWKAMRGVIRYLTSTHRGTFTGSEK